MGCPRSRWRLVPGDLPGAPAIIWFDMPARYRYSLIRDSAWCFNFLTAASMAHMVFWPALVVVIVVVASCFPVQQATNLRMRPVLAYNPKQQQKGGGRP